MFPDGTHRFILFLQLNPLQLRHRIDVFIAAAGQVDQNHWSLPIFGALATAHARAWLDSERGDDAFEAAQQIKGFECFVVFGDGVFDALDVVQVAVFRADAG